MKKLSIITINYNNSLGLEKTIKSVVEQIFVNYEYIIIDGGSIDGSVNVIKKYSTKINYWISEKDSGIYNAMNKGIKKATGEYCLFLNSGDSLIDEKVLSKVFSKKYSESILYGEIQVDNLNPYLKIEKLPETISLAFLFNHNIWHPASFIKREIFDNVGLYNEQYRIASDYDFFFHSIIINKVSIFYLPFIITRYDSFGISSIRENLDLIEKERSIIHNTYLPVNEIEYLNNLKKFKNISFAKWLVNKPTMTRLFTFMLSVYSKLRN